MNRFFYAFVFCLFAFGVNAQLIISQYYEGLSNDKFIEITNRGGATINFSTTPYYLALYANAAADNPSTSSPNNTEALTSGTLASGASLLFRHTSAATPAYAVSASASSTTCNFNGDDLLILSTSTGATAWANRTDVIGDGSSWGVDVSFYRNLNSGPSTTYTPSEWTSVANTVVDVAATGTTERLGVHVTTILPIELLSFNAKQNQGKVNLNWATATELDNKEFIVERAASPSAFTKIASIASAGNAESQQNYSYVDAQPLTGVSYYRLRQVDIDGSESFSPVVSVDMKGKTSVMVYPNPATERFMLSMEENKSDRVFHLYNLQGQIVRTSIVQEGQTLQEVELNGLPDATYFLREANNTYVLPVVKK